jgi:hypothetical protein
MKGELVVGCTGAAEESTEGTVGAEATGRGAEDTGGMDAEATGGVGTADGGTTGEVGAGSEDTERDVFPAFGATDERETVLGRTGALAMLPVPLALETPGRDRPEAALFGRPVTLGMPLAIETLAGASPEEVGAAPWDTGRLEAGAVWLTALAVTVRVLVRVGSAPKTIEVGSGGSAVPRLVMAGGDDAPAAALSAGERGPADTVTMTRSMGRPSAPITTKGVLLGKAAVTGEEAVTGRGADESGASVEDGGSVEAVPNVRDVRPGRGTSETPWWDDEPGRRARWTGTYVNGNIRF